MQILQLPNLRQTYDYDCGPTALQSVLGYYGMEIRKEHVIEHAKTSDEGTSVEGLLDTAKKYGLTTEAREMTLEDIKNYIDKKIPVLLVLQAWAEREVIDWKTNWEDGHYVVAIGYTDNTVIFEDPASIYLTYLSYPELEQRWHDRVHGKKYEHFGIAFTGKEPSFDREKMVHLD